MTTNIYDNKTAGGVKKTITPTLLISIAFDRALDVLGEKSKQCIIRYLVESGMPYDDARSVVITSPQLYSALGKIFGENGRNLIASILDRKIKELYDSRPAKDFMN